MKSIVGISFVAAAAFAASAAQADTLVFNSAPSDGWIFGSGNNYSPSNTAVLTTDAGSELYLRMHQTGIPAPASDGNGLYGFALGTTFISFDWGVDNNASGLGGLGIDFNITNVATGYVGSWYGLLPDNDNEYSPDGAVQNSARLNWVPGLGYDPNVDNTYRVQMNVSGLAGGDKSITVLAQVGAGAVPEPATWGMMILGLGAVGGALRSRKRTAVRFA